MLNRVECRSDFSYAERPVAFTWQGSRYEIIRVLAEWRLPQGKAFRVLVQAGQQFELFYMENEDTWEIRTSQ